MRYYVCFCWKFYLTFLICSFLFFTISKLHADPGLGKSKKQRSFSSSPERQFLQEMVGGSSLLYSFNTHYRVLLSTRPSTWFQGQTVDKKECKVQGNMLGSWVTLGPHAGLPQQSRVVWLRMRFGKSGCLIGSQHHHLITLGPCASSGLGRMLITITRNSIGLMKVEVCLLSLEQTSLKGGSPRQVQQVMAIGAMSFCPSVLLPYHILAGNFLSQGHRLVLEP